MENELYYLLSSERLSTGPFWWRQSEWGYTDKLPLAGKFSRDRAFEICRAGGFQDYPVPVAAFAGGENDERFSG